MTQYQHKHAAVTTRTTFIAFEKCVRADDCVPNAHGMITEVQLCRCGAIRHINRNEHNSGAFEFGRWENTK